MFCRVHWFVIALSFSHAAAAAADKMPAAHESFVRSPYNWVENEDGSLTSNTPGAYLRGSFTGGALRLRVDTLANQPLPPNQYPMLAWRVGDVAWQRQQLEPGQTHVDLIDAVGEVPREVEVVFTGVWWQAPRWTGGDRPAASLTLGGFEIDGGKAHPTPARLRRMIVFGDSNSEGYEARQIGVSVENQDAGQATPMILGQALDAEVGVVAFAGQGNLRGGGGGVPPMAEAWNQQWDGQSRLVDGKLSPPPDLIVNLHGQNDPRLTVDEVEALIARWRDAAPDALIVLAAPADLRNAKALEEATQADPHAHFISTGVDFLQTKRGVGAFHNANHLNVRGHALYAATNARLIGGLLQSEE